MSKLWTVCPNLGHTSLTFKVLCYDMSFKFVNKYDSAAIKLFSTHAHCVGTPQNLFQIHFVVVAEFLNIYLVNFKNLETKIYSIRQIIRLISEIETKFHEVNFTKNVYP